MTTFTVVDRDRPGQTLFATDDWVAAEAFALDSPPRRVYDVRGTHPTHQWDTQSPRRCTACSGWDNGSYGSHAPCGYDFAGESLFAHIRRLQSATATAAGEGPAMAPPADAADTRVVTVRRVVVVEYEVFAKYYDGMTDEEIIAHEQKCDDVGVLLDNIVSETVTVTLNDAPTLPAEHQGRAT